MIAFNKKNAWFVASVLAGTFFVAALMFFIMTLEGIETLVGVILFSIMLPTMLFSSMIFVIVISEYYMIAGAVVKLPV